MDMDISMDIQAKSVDMDMDGKFHIHGNPAYMSIRSASSMPLAYCKKRRPDAVLVYFSGIPNPLRCIGIGGVGFSLRQAR